MGMSLIFSILQEIGSWNIAFTMHYRSHDHNDEACIAKGSHKATKKNRNYYKKMNPPLLFDDQDHRRKCADCVERDRKFVLVFPGRREQGRQSGFASSSFLRPRPSPKSPLDFGSCPSMKDDAPTLKVIQKPNKQGVPIISELWSSYDSPPVASCKDTRSASRDFVLPIRVSRDMDEELQGGHQLEREAPPSSMLVSLSPGAQINEKLYLPDDLD